MVNRSGDINRIYISLLDKINEIIGKRDKVLLFAIYGSGIYKSLDQIRDVDAFAVYEGKSVKTGRVDIFFLMGDIEKKASVYIISESDFYSDISTGEFGGRWPVIIFHGAIIEDRFQNYYFKLYSDSLYSLSEHLGIQMLSDPEDFFRCNNIKICQFFPFYISSVIGFCKYSQFRRNNYRQYENGIHRIINNSLNIKKADNILYRYLQTELMFRENATANIRSLRTKLEASKIKLETNRDILINYYGKESYYSLYPIYGKISELIENMQINNKELVVYYGKFFL